MRKTTFLFLLIVVTFRTLANAQEDIAHGGKWQLSIFYAPEMGYRTLHSEDSSFNRVMIPYREDVEKPAWGYYTGGGISYRFGKHLTFKSGIAITERSYQLPKVSITIGAEYNLVVLVKHASTTHFAQKYRFGYISVPLTAEYEWQLRKVKLGVFAGGTADYFLYYKIKTTEFDGDNNRTVEVINRSKLERKYNVDAGYKNVVGNLLTGMSLSLPARNRIGLAISPYAKWSTPVIVNKVLTQSLYSYGLNFAVTYDL